MKLLVSALVWGVICQVGSVHGAGDPVRQLKPEFSFGAHPLLKAEVVELDLQVSQTRTRDHDLSKNKSVAEVVGQDLALSYRLFPQPWIEVTNEFKMGFSKQHQIDQGFFEDETRDRWHQLQKAQIALQDDARRVQVRIYEQFRQDFHGDRDLPDRRLRLGGRADLRLTRQLSLSPSWWQEEHWAPNQLPSSHKEEFGARLSWKAFQGFTIAPEAAEQRHILPSGEVREQQRIGVGFSKKFKKARLSWNATPGYEEQFVEVGHGANHRIHKIDSSVAWNPDQEWSVRTGGTVEHRENYVQQTDHTRETVYSQVKHRPIEELTIRLRGDYRLSESSKENRPELDRSNARMKVSLTPELQLNEHLYASARYLLEYHDEHNGERDQQEQVFTVSLHSQF